MDNVALSFIIHFQFSEKHMRKFVFSLAFVFALSISIFAQPYKIEQYLNIKSASSPQISADGKQLVYLTNQTGTSQVWSIALPNGKPEQLTYFDDNISFVRWVDGGKALVFGMASGGDENTQFYWMTSQGDAVEKLTDQPKIRHNFADVSKDGKKLYYSSNKRNRNWFDIYSYELDTEKETLLYQHDGSNSLAAVSADGSKIIISRASTRFSLDNDLYLYEIATKKETHLTPHDEPTQYRVIDFSPDGRAITLGTDQNGEFIAYSRMDLATKKITTLQKADWDLNSAVYSDDRKTFAYTTNKEGFSELFITPTTAIGRAHTPVKLPAQGIVGGMSFSKDGKVLTLNFSSPSNNTDIWLYDLKTNKLTQVTKSDLAGIDPKTFVAPELIKFKTFDGREIPAWYYRAKVSAMPSASLGSMYERSGAAKTVGKVPVIVSVHGGPEGQSRPGFNPLFQYYLSRGYAVLDPNVRGSTGYGKVYSHLDDVEKREDSVKDLAAAHDWLVASGGADPKRIAVMGGSYGGYMTMAAITLYPDKWAAAVNTVGIVNWETFLQNTSGYRRRQREVEYGMLDKNIEFLRRISPIKKIDRIKAPLFVIHGKNDPRVPYTEAEQVVEALRKRNAIVEYKLYDDEGHGISKLKNRLELYPLVADFLDKYMK